MAGVAAAVAITAVLALAVLAADWVARQRHWRVGRITRGRYANRVWRIETRWGPALIHGSCEKCGTSWRYVDPHPLAVSPYGQLAILYPFCVKCHEAMPRMERRERYLTWWLDRRDAIAAEGDQPVPDVREWDEIETQLRVEMSPNRLVA